MKLDEIAKRILICTKCPLHQNRTNTVPGEGDSDADLMFIGEGPGENEDKQGRPFVGAAGKYLEELLGKISLTREQVFIGNVVKCRPPGNRDPMTEEVAACWPYMEQQIAALEPKLIVTLGRHAMERFIPGKQISKVHGRPFRVREQVYYPIYHPAAALYRGAVKPILETDFMKIPKVLAKVDELNENPNRGAEVFEQDKPKQGKLL